MGGGEKSVGGGGMNQWVGGGGMNQWVGGGMNQWVGGDESALFQRFHKFQRSSALFQNGLRKPALFQSCSALVFSESALFRDFQVMNSAETDLKFF